MEVPLGELHYLVQLQFTGAGEELATDLGPSSHVLSDLPADHLVINWVVLC